MYRSLPTLQSGQRLLSRHPLHVISRCFYLCLPVLTAVIVSRYPYFRSPLSCHFCYPMVFGTLILSCLLPVGAFASVASLSVSVCHHILTEYILITGRYVRHRFYPFCIQFIQLYQYNPASFPYLLLLLPSLRRLSSSFARIPTYSIVSSVI